MKDALINVGSGNRLASRPTCEAAIAIATGRLASISPITQLDDLKEWAIKSGK